MDSLDNPFQSSTPDNQPLPPNVIRRWRACRALLESEHFQTFLGEWDEYMQGLCSPLPTSPAVLVGYFTYSIVRDGMSGFIAHLAMMAQNAKSKEESENARS